MSRVERTKPLGESSSGINGELYFVSDMVNMRLVRYAFKAPGFAALLQRALDGAAAFKASGGLDAFYRESDALAEEARNAVLSARPLVRRTKSIAGEPRRGEYASRLSLEEREQLLGLRPAFKTEAPEPRRKGRE